MTAKAIFITGTGTDVGKTFVAALLVRALRQAGLNAGYYKAALSGASRDREGKLVAGDAAYVAKIAGLTGDPNARVSYIYESPVSPHLAAQRENQPIEIAKIRRDYDCWSRQCDYLIVEGSGGIACPLRRDHAAQIMLVDIIRELNLPAIIVGNSGLGAINAFALTVEYLTRRDIPLRGLVFNRYRENEIIDADNAQVIAEITGAAILAKIKNRQRKLSQPADLIARIFTA